MKKKQFKTESQKLLDMMINSIYTHKEIFLRELISNASDALDKLYFRSLTDSAISISRSDLAINISYDKDARILIISDNGCGMNEEDLEKNLGTIAKSGSFDFKNNNDQGDDIDVIGQFGVGFYSAFMVADKITVKSRVWSEETAHVWESEGADGYRIGECEKESFGSEIILHIKPDTDDENYSEFLDEYRIRSLVKKYSDYIRYPIKMAVTKSRKKDDSEDYESYTEMETLNSMIPLWKKNRSEINEEEYNSFYTEKYYDYQPPLRVITQKSEGSATYNALMFIPSHAPYNYYTQEFERGLELYSSGVMIMECCKDLLPDYFGFVRGVVDSSDLSLNISREMLQHDRQLKVMAKAIEKKIKNELASMMESDREKYEKFFAEFGVQLKYGVYSDYGMHKEMLQDLLLFKSSSGKYLSLKQYVDGMKAEQEFIYYASGETVEKIEMLPKVETAKSRGYEVLYLTDDVDEFALRVLESYNGKEFKNVTADLGQTEDEESKERIKNENEENSQLLDFIKETVGSVSAVRFTSSLGSHAVCLTSEGEISAEMERILRKMPGAEVGVPGANIIMEINSDHPIKAKLISLYESDKEKLKSYARLLYAQGRLIGGMSIDDPAELCRLMEALMV